MAGPVVVVTGGAKGLGYAFCEEVLQAGGKAGIIDVDIGTGTQAVDQLTAKFGPGRAIFRACDVTGGPDQVFAAFDDLQTQLGSLDVVVNNAGMGENSLEPLLKLNVVAVIHGTEQAMALRRRRGRGPSTIINMASAAGLHPLDGAPYYTASKYAVVGYTRTIAPKASGQGITVHCACPSFADTDLVRKVSNPEFRRTIDKLGVMDAKTVAESLLTMCDEKKPLVVQITPANAYSVVFGRAKL